MIFTLVIVIPKSETPNVQNFKVQTEVYGSDSVVLQDTAQFNQRSRLRAIFNIKSCGCRFCTLKVMGKEFV
ncbi:UNVERIFIED_CONTAM: hypothetical protein RMT77_004932 [Armadillidium vulgare]